MRKLQCWELLLLAINRNHWIDLVVIQTSSMRFFLICFCHGHLGWRQYLQVCKERFDTISNWCYPSWFSWYCSSEDCYWQPDFEDIEGPWYIFYSCSFYYSNTLTFQWGMSNIVIAFNCNYYTFVRACTWNSWGSVPPH
jgi:hypothetical protein